MQSCLIGGQVLGDGPWLFSSLLLLGAATAAGLSTYLHWADCRGSMLDGTLFDLDRSDPVLSDACLLRMDGGLPFPNASRTALAPGASVLGAIAVILAGVAWMPLILGLGWRSRTRFVAALPVAVSLVLVIGSWLWSHFTGSEPGSSPFTWLVLPVELCSLAAGIAILQEDTDWSGRTIARLGLLAWGASAFGWVHLMFFDYGVMVVFSSINWDVPPGTGYLTAALLAVAALGVLSITVRDDPRRPQVA